MAFGTRMIATAATALLALLVASPAAVQPQRPAAEALPDYDVREWRAPAPPSPAAAEESNKSRQGDKSRRPKLHPHTGAIRVVDAPGVSLPRGARGQGAVAALARRLGLAADDVGTLTELRDYLSPSTGLRHVVVAQAADGIPVFDGVVSLHSRADGEVVRLSSGAAPLKGRRAGVVLTAADAAIAAVGDVRPAAGFAPVAIGGAGGPTRATVFDRGPFAREVTASLTWLPMDGGLRLAWHVYVEPEQAIEAYDILIDAETGERLVRRNRVRTAAGNGRVLQSAAMQALDPRRPDARPYGADGCPPVVNHQMRSLTAPFRDPATVLFNTGALAGNNARIYRGTDGTPAATGTFDGAAWNFDFPFNSAGSAETALFFALNYAHDFFYDLGFDEAAGNFQADNFGRGGVGGDSIKGLARAVGRNNATFMPAPEGSSPIISMFLFDGTGCWSSDTDGDGSIDLDGDFDLDIVIHEFGHGVSTRLNTAFEGSEAEAMGEGISDFFAYSITNETTLGDYAWPGGLRGVNEKTYSDWTCFFGFFCEPHANGEIWANVMWDVRERFRRDQVRGGESAGITESHQLAIEALKLSPPAPTMLDMRDAMLLADSIRNPGSDRSQNFCRLWEPFAARGMGVNASDTADNGFNQVRSDFTVPSGCEPPPPPPTVSVAATAATAHEAGPTNGTFTISRGVPREVPLIVKYNVGGSALRGTDYQTLSGSATIPAGAAAVTVDVVPIDDALLEPNETVVLSLSATTSYVIGTPASATVTIVSDDVAADFVVTALTAPLWADAGATIQVTDTTKNQGTGASSPSETWFYLSKDLFLDATDTLLGSRTVDALAVGASGTGSASVTLPTPLTAGQYTLIAKADGPGAVVETSELNNVRTTGIRIGPDLTVSAFSVPTTPLGAGASLTVSDTTTNAGASTAAASTTRFYLSVNSLWDAADVALQGRSIPALAPGAASSGTTTITIPAGTATGTYYLVAKADGLESVPEVYETNNTRLASVRIGPDLVLTALSGPSIVGAGMQIAVSETTANSGGGAAGASNTRFYISTNAIFDAADVPLESRAVPALVAGASSPATTVVTIPATLGAGSYYLIAYADFANDLPETVETNNTRALLVRVGPDLVVSSVIGPARTEPGGTIALTATTRNSGAGPAAASSTAWYLSSNFLLDAADVPLSAAHAVSPLDAGASATGTVNAVLPEIAPGTWYLIAVADDGKVVPETTETNNTRYTTVLVGPDLLFTAVSVPSTFAAGSTTSVSETVFNQGSDASASRTRFYLSTNYILDAGDIVLPEFRDVPELAPRTSSAATTKLSIPAGLAGSYYLLIVADGDGSVAESSEVNNVAWRVVQITQ